MSTIAIHPSYTPARPRTTAAAELRLTRRGRAVVFLVALVLLLAAAVAFGTGSVATQEPGEPVLTEMHLVSNGETLWAIADRIDDTGRTAAMVDRIEEMNGLETANLVVGQKLRVPVAE